MSDRTNFPTDSDPDMDEALRRVRAGGQVMTQPTPQPDHGPTDWAEDLAHERLVDFTRTNLAAAKAAAAGAEAATVQLGFIQLARDLTQGQPGGTSA
ncbi:hypothetical protein [Streptomyces sp. NPDC057238]|uniref:hypothetical protein n=1 Tax=Streptomyces sp. NPDC057238 TaxID=3346060 RepID=UPI0036419201